MGYKDLEPHLPKIASMNGFLTLVTVGTLLELSSVLSRLFYLPDYGGMSKEDREEMLTARYRYRLLINWYSRNYVLQMNHQWVHPSYVAKRHLLDTALCLNEYAKSINGKASRPEEVTTEAIQDELLRHFHNHAKDLYPAFKERRDIDGHNSLSWEGDKFTPKKRTPSLDLLMAASGSEEICDMGPEWLYLPISDIDVVEIDDEGEQEATTSKKIKGGSK